jgi:2,4-dienoyl-CoA reductase-like NADH-dependent reductase (Old Yellow Enzyme family)
MPVADTLSTYRHLLSEASKLNLAYVHVQRWIPMFDPKRRGTVIEESTWRSMWKGPLLLNGAFTPKEGQDFVQRGLADAIVFGRDWMANPDLVERIEKDLPLNAGDMYTWFGQ